MVRNHFKNLRTTRLGVDYKLRGKLSVFIDNKLILVGKHRVDMVTKGRHARYRPFSLVKLLARCFEKRGKVKYSVGMTG